MSIYTPGSPTPSVAKNAYANHSGAQGSAQQRLGLPRHVQWIIMAALFFAISRAHGEFGILVQVRILMLLMAAGLGFLVLNAKGWRPAGLQKQAIPKAVGFIFGVAVVGVPFGITPGRSFWFLVDYVITLLASGLLAWALTRVPRGIVSLARVVAAAGVTTALLALYRGRLDSVGRLSGAVTYDPNDLALVVNVTFPLLIWWAFDRRSRWRWPAMAAIPPVLWTLILTGSRGGFLGLAVILVGFIGITFQKVPKRARRAGLVVLVLAVAAIPILPADYINRMSTIVNPEDDYNLTSETGRIQVWKRGVGYAIDRPIFGLGIDNFNWAEGTISELAQRRQPGEGLKFSAAHSAYIQVLAELGFPAGVVFAAMLIGTPFALVFRHRRRKPDPLPTDDIDVLAPFAGLSMAGFAVSAFFLSFAYYDILYILLALAAGILAHRKARFRDARRRHLTARQRAAAVGGRPGRIPGRTR